MSDYVMKDSGERQGFTTGAVRDLGTGKGAYDLISPIALKRLAQVLEKGAVKYAARNWEAGIPICRSLQSSIRHIEQYIEGYRDEDHLGQAMTNLHFVIHTMEMINRGVLPADLNDLPDYNPLGDWAATQEKNKQKALWDKIENSKKGYPELTVSPRLP